MEQVLWGRHRPHPPQGCHRTQNFGFEKKIEDDSRVIAPERGAGGARKSLVRREIGAALRRCFGGAAGLATGPVRSILERNSDAMSPEARCHADRPCPEGSKSRNRLSALLAWPVSFFCRL